MNKTTEQKKHYIYQDGKEIIENDKKISPQKTSNANGLEQKKKKERENNLTKKY